MYCAPTGPGMTLIDMAGRYNFKFLGEVKKTSRWLMTSSCDTKRILNMASQVSMNRSTGARLEEYTRLTADDFASAAATSAPTDIPMEIDQRELHPQQEIGR